MGVLEGKRVYLGGPIQYDPTRQNWRTEPKQILAQKFGLNIFDPFDDPKQQWLPDIEDARKIKDYKKMSEIAHQFLRKDLCIVDRSDFLISYVPHKVPTTGTVHEIINSNNAKKPTLLVTNYDDISYIALWYFGFIKTEFMFAGWNALFDYLDEVDRGLHKHNNRWDFIYGNI